MSFSASSKTAATTTKSTTTTATSTAQLSGMHSKSVVFSQWTSLLDIVQARLGEAGITSVRLDGQMNLATREMAVRAFQTDPTVHVILVSLNAGGTGITLTAATNCFVLDLPYNPAAQDQAVDRVHRLGQVSPVHIVLMVSANTIEENVLQLQERKRGVAAGAFGAVRSSEDIRKMRLDDLRVLMQRA